MNKIVWSLMVSVILVSCHSTKNLSDSETYTPIAVDTADGLGNSPIKNIEIKDHQGDAPVVTTPEQPSQPEDVIVPEKPTKAIFKNPFEHVFAKDTINIAVLLPINLWKTPTTSAQKQSFSFDAPTKMALDFYQGMLVALPKLNGLGIHANIEIYDDQNDEGVAESIVNKPAFSKTDIIIGPIYNKNLRTVANYAKQRETPMFSPLSASSSITESNPYYFTANATNESHYAAIYQELIKRFDGDTVYIFREGTDDEAGVVKVLNSKNKEWGERIVLIEKVISKSWDTTKVPLYFTDTLPKNIIIPSYNKTFVGQLIGRLKLLPKNHFNIYGLSTWSTFDKKSLTMKNGDIFCTASNYLQYSNSEYSIFKSTYEAKFDKKPGDASIQAHDLVVYLATLLDSQAFNPYGNSASESIQYIQTQFGFVPNKSADGQVNYYDNSFVYILKFDQASQTFVKY